MADSTSPIPVGTRLLHIGPQKTGSTAIQFALHLAMPELATHGVHYATGGRARPAVAGWAFGLAGRPAGSDRPPMRAWNRLVRQVASSDADRVMISNEDFSRATPEQIPQLLDAFGGASRIRVVLVARRLDLFLPSQWQERVKAGNPMAYDEWLRMVLDRGQHEWVWERFNVWRSHDLEKLIERWSEHIDQRSITVVVLDEADRRQLPATFEQLLGLPDGLIKTVSDRSNRGLTWGECEIVRGINEAFDERGWSKAVRRRFVQREILNDLRDRTPPPGPKSPPLPAWAADQLRELAAERVDWLEGSALQVLGDLDSLRMPSDAVTVDDPYPEPPLPRRVIGDIVMSLIAATLAAEEAQAAAIDVEVDDEDVEDDGEPME